VPVAHPPPAGKGGGAEQHRFMYIPLKLPLDSARHAFWNEAWILLFPVKRRMRLNDEY
jgi:hypothetical protein